MFWHIELDLKGGIKHVLGDVRSHKPGWADIHPSGIEGLQFGFLGKDEKGQDIPYRLEMRGMENYNFFVEAAKAVGGNKFSVKALWFLGQVPFSDQITGWVLKDKIIRISTVKGKEYNGIATMGWKPGVVGAPLVSRVWRTL